jgi:hypothetical protein
MSAFRHLQPHRPITRDCGQLAGLSSNHLKSEGAQEGVRSSAGFATVEIFRPEISPQPGFGGDSDDRFWRVQLAAVS